MKSIKELCHKNLRYAVRKTSLGVGSVAIAFVLAGSLPSQLVQADEWDDYMNSVLFPDVGGEGEPQPSGAVEAPSEEVVTEEPMVNEELKALQEEAKDIFTFDEGQAQSTTGTQGQLQGNDAAIEGSDDIFDQSLELGQGTDNALKLDDYINTGDKDTTYFLWNKYDTSVPENSPGKKAIILQQDGSGRTILYRKPDGSYGTFINGKDGVSQGQASNDQWENIALVIDQENKIGKFYLNGEFDSQVDLGNNVVNETTGLIIGAHKNPGSQDPHPFRGQIDDLQIFERVLTDDEVSLLYSEKAMAIVTRDQLEPLVAEVSRLISSLGFDGSTQEGQVLTAAFDQARKQAKDLESLKIAVTNLKEAYRAYQNLAPKPVTIDSEDVLRIIDSSSIFGINHRYAFNGYGSFDPETGQIRDDFKTLFDQVDFGSFRYPGGTISNLFNWKTAIGPVEGRKDQIHGFYNNPGQGGIAANFGLPELISFADQADSEIVYVYSLARGNAQDVADLMEYFNAEVGTNINGGIDWAAVRAQDGHPDPINVRFFEIGNEMQQGAATGDGQWSQKYWVQFVPGKTPVEAYIDGGTAVLNRQYAVKEEDWNQTASYSDGTANQVFYMRYANVNPKMLDTSGNIVDDPDFVAVNPGSVQVFVNDMADWSEVSNFDNSRATDKHYVIDYSTGFIHFGDGVHGQIPGRNQQITVSYSVEKDGFNAISQSLKDTMKAIDGAEGKNREANVYTSFESSGFIDLMRSRDTEDLYDGMTIHPYSGTVSGGSNTAIFYDNAMKKAEDVGIQHVQNYVNMLPEGKVPVISEFGIFRNTEPQVRSLTGALYTAKVMMSYVTLGSPYIQRHTLVDWYSSGADSLGPTQQAVIQAVPIDGSSTLTGEGEFDFFLTPSALVIEMYNDMLGNDIINAQVEGIEKLENGVNPVNVLVSKDEEGNVYIAAVNVARDMDYVLDLNIRGINLDGKLIDVQELTADDIAGENTLENPNAVQIKRTSYLSDKDSTFTLSKHSFVVLKINQALVPGPVLEPISDQEKTEEELVFEQVDPEQLPNDGYVYSGLAYKGTLLLADTYTSQRNISQDDVTSALSDPTYLDKVFTIYPSPQSITYREGVADLTGGVQLIIGQGVDVYTINLAKKVLQEHQISYTLTDVFDPESTLLPILLGVLERSQAITGQEANPELFESDHYDAYSLSIAPSSISILGATSDGVFYGLQSLEDMLSDSDLPLLRSVLIEDYADVKNRGFIEGYYGEPWSVEDRIALMKFGGEIKMNAYYFAPKDDPYHDSQWRQLYPEHELEAIEEMARIGNETKNRFVWTIHPFQSQRLTFGTAYQGDLQIIKDKFDQLMAHGVRQFGVLADDIDNVGDPNNYVRLMTDLTNFLKERQATYPDLKVDMIFVAPGYTYAAASGANYTLRILNRNLPDTVDLTLTGGKVFGEVSNQVLDNFTDENGNQYKPIHMWINWPVNDQSRNTLIMGGAEYYLKPGLDPAKVAGIMLNPMMESEPSKVALFNAAEYTWNIWDDEAHVKSQRPAQFAFVDHGDYSPSTTSEALDLLASNLAFNGGQADVYAESVYLKKPIADFQEGLTDGSLTAEEVNQLARYFRDIKEAAELYLTDGNPALVDQMRPFLLDAVDKMTALVPLVENAINLDSKNQTASTPFGRSDADAIAQVYKAYTIAKDAYAKSLQHNFVYFQAGNEIREAEFGVEVITPFLSSLLATYENQLNALFSNRVKGAIVETEGLIEETGEETADLGNAIDANLETAYSSASSDGQILYHLSQDPQLTGPINQVVLITRIDEGVQATLTAILEDGSSLDLGQIRDGLNLYNTQQNVTDLSLNWTGGTLSLVDIAGKGIPSIQEVISNISQELKNNQLNQESKDALAYLLTKANSLLENSTSNLEELNTVQSLLEQSLSSLFNSERIPASEITARNDASELLRANQPITNAFDDNPETQWHTNWDGVPMEDMTIYATLDQPSVIDSIRILARPLGNKNGVIQVMDVYGSLTDDPADAFLIAQGIQTGLQAGADRTLPLDNDKALKMLIIKPTATDGESASLRNQFASAREISFTRLIANDSLNSELLASIEALRQSDQKEAEEADIDYSSLDALIDSYDLMTSDPRFTYLPVGVKDQITHFISNRELIKENPEVTQDLIDQTTTVLQQLLQNYQALLEQIVIPDTGDQGGDTEVPVNSDTDDQSGDTDVLEKPDEQDPVVDPDETVTDKGDPVYTEPAPSFDLAADDDNDGFTNDQELTAGSDYQDPTSQPVSDTPIDEPETTVTDKGEPAYADPAPSFDLAADDDNDGFTNGQELAAGSDYQDPTSHPTLDTAEEELVTDKGEPAYADPAPSFDLAADDDNDGFTNGQELAAGSDYQDSTSHPTLDTAEEELVTDKGEPAYADPAPALDLVAVLEQLGYDRPVPTKLVKSLASPEAKLGQRKAAVKAENSYPAALPNTGDASAVAFVVTGLAMSLLGFGLGMRNRED
ncbi:beta-N-acetylglucosaminidase domain-containing protein [Streptococcus hyovaginalis]